MPLTPYLKGAVFDPQAIEVMDRAFAAVRESLHSPPEDDPTAEIAARKIIDLARAGERDPARLCELVLLDLKIADPRIA
jgi:hypothetical protein